MENVGDGVRDKRMEFLKNCIAHNGSPEFSDKQRFEIYDLAYDWKLDADQIKAKVVNFIKFLVWLIASLF